MNPTQPANLADPPATLAELVARERLPAVTDRWREIQRCCNAQAWTAALVLLGSLVDALMAERLGGMKSVTFQSRYAPLDGKRRQALDLAEWPTRSLVAVAHDLMILEDATHALAQGALDWRTLVVMPAGGPRAPAARDVHVAIALLNAVIADLVASRMRPVERFRSEG